MKHTINTSTGICKNCKAIIHTYDQVLTGCVPKDKEPTEPRMQRAANALEEAKQFTDKLKALGEELGFTVVEVGSQSEFTEMMAKETDNFADTIEAMKQFASSFKEGKAEQPFNLDKGQYDLLKMLVEQPMPANHIGILQLPLEHIEMMCTFKRNDLIKNHRAIGSSYWHVTTKGLDAITAYNKPNVATLTLDQLCALTHMYHADTWDLDDVYEYQAKQDVNNLIGYGLVQYRSMTSDWVLTEAGVNHIQKILALTV